MFFKKKDPEKEAAKYLMDRSREYACDVLLEVLNKTGKYSRKDLRIADKSYEHFKDRFYSKYPEERGKNKKK